MAHRATRQIAAVAAAFARVAEARVVRARVVIALVAEARVVTARVAVVLGVCVLGAACTGSEPGPIDNTFGAATDVAIAPDNSEVGRQRVEDDPDDDHPVHAAADVFLQDHSVESARSFVELVALDSDQRWVPWLLDLLRLGLSNILDQEIGVVLAELSGIPSTTKVPNLVAHGGWSRSLGLDGGQGYRTFKSRTYELFDPRFGDLLRSVEDQSDLAAIQFGGVPLGGIPELNAPARLRANEATWMTGDEAVLGVEIAGEAVAYPIRILGRHELINDVVGGLPISVVYCTLCRSALVFDAVADGQALTFLTSGLLLDSNKIMYDNETGSLWQHLTGTGIAGPMTGTELNLRLVEHVRWSDWVMAHPDGEVIDLPQPVFFENPEQPPIVYDYSPDAAYRSYYDSEKLWFPVGSTPDSFALKTEVVGIVHSGESMAIELAAITETIEISVGGNIFIIEPTGPSVRITDSSGDIVQFEQSFWFAWVRGHPDTRIWK